MEYGKVGRVARWLGLGAALGLVFTHVEGCAAPGPTIIFPPSSDQPNVNGNGNNLNGSGNSNWAPSATPTASPTPTPAAR